MFPDLRNNLKGSGSSLYECSISYSILKRSFAPRILITISGLADRNTNDNELVHLPLPGTGILESSPQRTPTTAKASQILVPIRKSPPSNMRTFHPKSSVLGYALCLHLPEILISWSNLRTFIRNQNVQGYPPCLLLLEVDRIYKLSEIKMLKVILFTSS